jgi:hypothetical protein
MVEFNQTPLIDDSNITKLPETTSPVQQSRNTRSAAACELEVSTQIPLEEIPAQVI